jgi:hypothetical protein
MSIPGRVAVLVTALACAVPGPAVAADESRAPLCGTSIHAGEGDGLVWFPQGELFCQLVADPKAIRTFATYLWGKFPTNTNAISVGSVGIADGFGFFRIGGRRAGDGVQLGIEGAVFSQFALRRPGHDLLNADYLVGFPLTFRLDGFSARARFYHQSSHLGDKLLLRGTIRRQNLSFESAELILSQELAFVRVYAGGEYLTDRSPSTLGSSLAHFGAELRHEVAEGTRLVAAVDVKSTKQQDWKPAVSVRAGVEVARLRSPRNPLRVWSVLAEYYDGPSPYGQFFLDSTQYEGIGFHLQL